MNKMFHFVIVILMRILFCSVIALCLFFRYGRIEEDDSRSRLFTLTNPVARTGKQLAFLQLWEPMNGELKKSTVVNESLSALSVRDDGRFVAVGTMFTGTVFLYIAFSLQVF